MKDETLDKLTPSQEVVAFRVAGQDFCFDLASIREIRGWTEATILPHVEPYVTGVINLRGSVVPVIDLSERFGFGKTDPGARHVIIIANLNDQTLGLLAEVVSDILSFGQADLQPIPEIVETSVNQFISGVFLHEGRMIRKVELAHLLPGREQNAA